MLFKKDIKIVFFAIFCIFLNIIGKYSANSLQLPLWLDSFGTVLAASVLGPFSGAVVGVTVNVVFSGVNAYSYAYSITSISIGVLVGIVAKKKWFDSFYTTMCASLIITVISVLVSITVNWIFAEGMTGNAWGDGVISFFKEQGVPIFISSCLGQFYIDFLDRVLTLLLLCLIIKIYKKRSQILRKLIKLRFHLRNVFLFLFIAGIFSSQKLSAQTQFKNQDFTSYVQTLYSSSNGLPCGEANDIAQTSDGILWIGTYAGLYRYNGSEFRWMKNFDSVRNVNCLYVDEEGRLWIGTNDNGLSICINGEIITELDYEDGLPSNSVRAIVKGSDGYYYVGTSIGILVLELNCGLRICNILKDVGYTVGLSADKRGYVSAITSNGELFILSGSEVLYSQSLGNDKELYNCCSFDSEGILNIGTSKNHIYKYEISDDGTKLLGVETCGNLNYLNKIYFSEDRCFVCADDGIGFFSEGKPFHFIETGAFNSSIDNMTIDYQGNYWFTSSRQGLLRISSSSFTNIYGSRGFSHKVVNSVVKWNDALYVGTDNGLDIIKDGNLISNQLSKRFKDVRIRCLLKDSKNHLWICTYGIGLAEVFPDGRLIFYDSSKGEIGNRLRVAIELKDGTIVAAGVTGVSYIKDHKIVNYVTYGKNQNNAQTLSLMEMQDGTILAGTDGDGIAVIKNGVVTKFIRIKDGLSSDVILRTVYAPDKKRIFVVTSNSLCYFDSNFKIHKIPNFPYFNNYDIHVSDDGNLFVLGSAGIYVVKSETLLSGIVNIQFDLLDSKSGLDSSLTANAWNYCDEDGKLYLSCGTGVYVLNTKNYFFGKLSYHMMVSSVNLDGVPFQVERSEPLIIKRNTTKIEIFPEVVNYTVLDPFVSYWLEGFEPRETIIPQSQLSSLVYTNLPYGNYTFHIAVFDKEQNVIEQSSYQLIKEQELYDLKIFKAYILLVAFLAVAGITWVIVRNQMTRKLEIQKKQVELANEQVRIGNETILAIAKAVDAKDGNTSQHSMRVSEYSVLIAKEMGFTDDECENIRKAALLHDIGKIGIPDRILNKPTSLTDEEYEIMKSHVTHGAEILKDFTVIEHVQEGVLYHHEKYDGSGYPQGLKGDAIPLYGRIIGVADAFDAMTANRVYRKKLNFNYVIEEIKKSRGTQFDPKITDIMLNLIEEGKIDISALYEKKMNKNKTGEGVKKS